MRLPLGSWAAQAPGSWLLSTSVTLRSWSSLHPCKACWCFQSVLLAVGASKSNSFFLGKNKDLGTNAQLLWMTAGLQLWWQPACAGSQLSPQLISGCEKVANPLARWLVEEQQGQGYGWVFLMNSFPTDTAKPPEPQLSCICCKAQQLSQEWLSRVPRALGISCWSPPQRRAPLHCRNAMQEEQNSAGTRNYNCRHTSGSFLPGLDIVIPP